MTSRVRSKLLLTFGVLSALLLVGCGGGDDGDDGNGTNGGAAGATVEVTAQDFSFSPTTLDVEPHAKVTVAFTNEGEAEHSFTVDELELEVEAEGGDSAETTFTAPDGGSYEFYCEYHPDQMQGTLSVGGDTGGGGGGGGGGNKPEKESPDNPKY